jgi:ubiquinone/menaquinone biosynthesis C-methylase UbiE
MLSKKETKDFYDKFGAKQDWQSFYENSAIKTLIKHSDFDKAKSVLEFGCGTGKFAKDLLENHLAKDCQYLGIDLSETMIEIASKRLKPFETQVKVKISDGSTEFTFPNNSFDRFVSNYVLDLLSDEQIGQVFTEANRILGNSGLLSITSLACGEGFLAKQVSNIWESIHKFRPKLVGGCRPLNLIAFVDKKIWKIKHHSKVSSFGITSEILVVQKMD